MDVDQQRNRRWGWGAFAAALLLFAGSRLAARSGVAHFDTWAYQWSWYPLLLAAEGLLAALSGRFALLSRPRFAASLFLWSVPVWLFFELLNFRIGNWFYVGVPETRAVRWLGYGLAFATVLPAVWLPYRILDRLGFGERFAGPSFHVGSGVRRTLAGAGVLFLALPLWRPDHFFPLVWGGAAFLLAPDNHRRCGADSLLGRIAEGRYGRLTRLLSAGLAAGLAWEGMNWIAGGRWIYTVPGLEELKLFEMPLLGFLGFPAFAVECAVIYRWLTGVGVAVPAGGGSVRGRRAVAAAALAVAFSVGVAMGVDRWTVASRRTTLADLPGLGVSTAERLRAAGIGSPAELVRMDSTALSRRTGVDPEEAGRWIRGARLAELRGLGGRGAAALWSAGIRDVCTLARTPAARIREILEPAGTLGPPPAHNRRVRVWIRAGDARCPSAGPRNAQDVAPTPTGARRLATV